MATSRGSPSVLQSFRLDRRLSIAELAEAAGMSRAQLVAVEAGERTLAQDQQQALAAALGIDAGELDALARGARG